MREVVAERTLFLGGEPAGGAHGVSVTLGAQRLSCQHYFPSGAVGSGAEYRLSLFNPSGTEAKVTLSFVAVGADGKKLSVPDLSISVPANGRQAQTIGDHFRQARVEDVADVGVRLVSDVEVAVEKRGW